MLGGLIQSGIWPAVLILFGTVLGAWIKGRPLMAKLGFDAQAKVRQEETNRIDKLELRVESLSARMIVVAQTMMELASVVERVAPDDPALRRYRAALKIAFPMTDLSPNEALDELARHVEEKGRGDVR